LVRSEYFPLSGCQRLTLHINEVYPEGSDGEPEKAEGAWVHYPVTGGKITCLHEGVGSKVTFSQKYRSGRVWWKKSYYAEFIIDLANSEVKGIFASHAVDFQMLEKELEGIVAATMIAGKYVTGANIQEDGSGLTVRMEGTTVDGAEFSVSGLFAERVTAVKSLSLLTEALEQYGKWGIRESSVSMESASGKLCWQLYMTMLLS
jgi:hypothetical protein